MIYTKRKRGISFILTIIILTSAVIFPTLFVEKEHNKKASLSTNAKADEIKIPQEEMRGMWVSYISLNMSGTDRNYEAFKEKIDTIIIKAKEIKCNTLIVQVRPFCDALYNSEYFPFSHILSGTQGVNPGYDALKYICKASHNEGLKVHAWINPYRIKTNDSPNDLSADNIYSTDPEICIETESGIYLNPAKKKSRELIINGVLEIIENYDIDGIQFDDYFYPPDIQNSDSYDYNAYKKSAVSQKQILSLEEFRETNVNILITQVYKAIKETKRNIIFGISPQGNISNDYLISADVKAWCKYEGYVDYICPQLYYPIENTTLGFEECLRQWAELNKHKSLKVYIGLGLYKAESDADNGVWKKNSNIIATEINLLRKYQFNGYMIYDYNSVISESAQKELENMLSVI